MKFPLNNNAGVPSDQEIDRDVAELRRLLEGAEGPREPHPAYWQNFLVHVRERIDEGRFRRRRRAPSIALASASAVALVAVVLVSGIFDKKGDVGSSLASNDRPAISAPAGDASGGTARGGASSRIADHLLASNADPLYDQDDTHRLVLDEGDVRMLNAIMSDNDAEIFRVIVDEGQ